MKITVNELRRIIKEEVSNAMTEAAGASALPTTFLEYRRLILSMLETAGAPEQFIMQLGSEGTPASLALETGWMKFDDAAVFLGGDPAAEKKALADAAYKTVMDASRKYRPGKGQPLAAKPLADALKNEILKGKKAGGSGKSISLDGVTLNSKVGPVVVDSAYVESTDPSYGELRVEYSATTPFGGDYYGDKMLLKNLRAELLKQGMSRAAVSEVDFSESGMQGDGYISLDVGEAFLGEWPSY